MVERDDIKTAFVPAEPMKERAEADRGGHPTVSANLAFELPILPYIAVSLLMGEAIAATAIEKRSAPAAASR